ncbi:hypothetical protein N2152v2_002066 [Parachlorella kessleri]
MPAKAPEKAEVPAEAGDVAKSGKKKRTANPGVRIQCRQKTAEVKAKCNSCKFHFCPKCLENRYGELVDEVNQVPGWSCPRCRGICNCSNCRKKQGLAATGQLANISKTAGFGSVSALLEKNPKAQALALLAPKPGTAPGAGGGEAAAAAGTAGHPATSAAAAGAATAAGGGVQEGGEEEQGGKRQKQPRKRPAAQAELRDESELGERPRPMPAPARLAIHKGAGAQAPGAKRVRGPAWLPSVPSVTVVEEGVQGGQLATVLEFVQVFAQPLKLKVPSLAVFGAELLQQQQQLLCSAPGESLVGHVHMRLIDVVREAWGFPVGASLSTWQPIMRGYYQEALQAAQQQREQEQQHGAREGACAARGSGAGAAAGSSRRGLAGPRQPPAVDGAELGAGGSSGGGSVERRGGPGGQEAPAGPEYEQDLVEDADGSLPEAAGGATGSGPSAAPEAKIEYPEGGYWGVPPGLRVAMLSSLLHDALDTYLMRSHIEGCMGDAVTEEKERKVELAEVGKGGKWLPKRPELTGAPQIDLYRAKEAGRLKGGQVRKETKEAIQQQRNREIALLITNAAGEGLSVEDQRRLVQEARERAEAAAAEKAAAKLQALTAAVHPPNVRAAPLGEDREGRRLFRLQAAPVLAGGLGVLAQTGGPEEGGGAGESWGAYTAYALPAVAASLHPAGRKEGPLRQDTAAATRCLLAAGCLPACLWLALQLWEGQHALVSAFKLSAAAVDAATTSQAPPGVGNSDPSTQPAGQAAQQPTAHGGKQAAAGKKGSQKGKAGAPRQQPSGEPDNKGTAHTAAPAAASPVKGGKRRAAKPPAAAGEAGDVPARAASPKGKGCKRAAGNIGIKGGAACPVPAVAAEACKEAVVEPIPHETDADKASCGTAPEGTAPAERAAQPARIRAPKRAKPTSASIPVQQLQQQEVPGLQNGEAGTAQGTSRKGEVAAKGGGGARRGRSGGLPLKLDDMAGVQS